jgi:hypothetical protein
VDDALALVADEVLSREGSARRQGFGLKPDERKAVETHAMAVARQHFEALGWDVIDTSSGNCYDLACRKGSRELRVEVKGTTGAGENVLLTRNEVAHARTFPDLALVVVSRIELSRGAAPSASGGSKRVEEPWRIDMGELSPLAYEYSLA